MNFPPLPAAEPDAIFAIAAAAKAAGPQAIDCTIGMYMDENGKPLLMSSVKKALEDIGKNLAERSYGYPPLLGFPEYKSAITGLLFGKNQPQVAGIAASGGTGAVAINLRLAKILSPEASVILPTPAWINHPRLCAAAGLPIIEVPNIEDGKASVAGILDALKKSKKQSVVLLQVSCHNPTGLDYEEDQWHTLADALAEHNAIAILDFAYQGFAKEIEEDAKPVRIMMDRGIPTLVCWSGSKNHSLYSERVGFACAVVPDDAMRKLAETHYGLISRSMYSAAPTFGESVVARVQLTYQREWQMDLSSIRVTLQRKRETLKQNLPERFTASLSGNGMFAQLPLTEKEMEELRTAHLVFFGPGGRINIAGVPMARVEELAEKIRKVVM